MRVDVKELACLVEFFTVLRDYAEASIALRRGRSARDKYERLVYEHEGKMAKVCNEALVLFNRRNR